ncbi:MAG: 4Fe-4S binding protein [Deltaproteobacteria bacterium]|nr:4Fe-4S binding protein [Deltaproteobacteria bacterium]
MADDVYKKLAKVLDTLPNGFPPSPTGAEIKLLKKIFEPEEAELFCDLRLKFETPEQIAQRTGRPLEGLDEMLTRMWKKGQIFGVDFGTTRVFKMMPWAFGIYEFQIDRMDREFAELCEEYNPVYGVQFFNTKPALMQVVPVKADIPAVQEALPYESVSKIIEAGQSFAVNDCICKKERRLLDKGCDKPLEVCMGIAPAPGVFENYHWGRVISKEEAYQVLQKAEEAGLVHLSGNYQNGQFFICNCCGCCCGVLQGLNQLNLPLSKVVNSHFFATIDPDQCVACGVCADERCQVRAIEEGEDFYRVLEDRCIGCGLCLSTCPSEAVTLHRRPDSQWDLPPENEDEWFEQRAKNRGVDYSPYR